MEWTEEGKVEESQPRVGDTSMIIRRGGKTEAGVNLSETTEERKGRKIDMKEHGKNCPIR